MLKFECRRGHQQQDYEGEPLPCAGCVTAQTHIIRKAPPAPKEWADTWVPNDFATEVVFTRQQLALDDPKLGRFMAWLWDCEEWRADRERQAAAKIKALPAENWS